jgi:hypothetical protein
LAQRRSITPDRTVAPLGTLLRENRDKLREYSKITRAVLDFSSCLALSGSSPAMTA